MGISRGAVHPNLELARFLREHHGAIDVVELRALGFTKDDVSRLGAAGRLVRQHRGVYRSGDAIPTTETHLRCALLAAGEDAAIARASAAHYRGHLDFAPAKVEVVIPRQNVGRSRDGMRVHHTKDLPRKDVETINGLRITTPLRTSLDLASETRTYAQYKLLRRAIRQATVADKRLPTTLDATVERLGPFRGSRVLSTLLDEHLERTALTRSELEEAFLELLREAGLPMPETNTLVEGFEVDGVWRLERVIVELDTYGFHGGVRSFEGDRDRDGDLAVAGYRVIRITGRRLAREPEKIKMQVRMLLGL